MDIVSADTEFSHVVAVSTAFAIVQPSNRTCVSTQYLAKVRSGAHTIIVASSTILTVLFSKALGSDLVMKNRRERNIQSVKTVLNSTLKLDEDWELQAVDCQEPVANALSN